MSTIYHILVKGSPGIGKTTIIKTIIQNLQKKKIPCEGFYSEEEIVNGYRVGFNVISIKDNIKKKLARIPDPGCTPNCPVVGRYAVDVDAFELLMRSILPDIGKTPTVLFIDEIGKMECFSKYFQQRVMRLFLHPNKTVLIVATIPVSHNLDLVKHISNLSNIELVSVDKTNRDFLGDRLTDTIFNTFNCLKNRSRRS